MAFSCCEAQRTERKERFLFPTRSEMHCDNTATLKKVHPLFRNKYGDKLTRAGVSYILDKYVSLAREANPDLVPENISCHSLRHSKAMHLLQSGVNLVYIRDFLGHYSIQTTEIYAKADSRQKREALEKAYVDVTPDTDPVWQANNNLLEWLVSLGK